MVWSKWKKSAECVGDGELRVDGGSVMCFRSLNGIPGTNFRDGCFRHWVNASHNPVSLRTGTKTLTRQL